MAEEQLFFEELSQHHQEEKQQEQTFYGQLEEHHSDLEECAHNFKETQTFLRQ